MGCGGRGPAGLGFALLYWSRVAGRGLAARRRAHPAPLPAGPAGRGSRWVSLTRAAGGSPPPPADSPPEQDYRQRSHRVRSRRPDRLSVIGQENWHKRTERKVSLINLLLRF